MGMLCAAAACACPALEANPPDCAPPHLLPVQLSILLVFVTAGAAGAVHLSGRLSSLERGQQALLEGQRALEAKLDAGFAKQEAGFAKYEAKLDAGFAKQEAGLAEFRALLHPLTTEMARMKAAQQQQSQVLQQLTGAALGKAGGREGLHGGRLAGLHRG